MKRTLAVSLSALLGLSIFAAAAAPAAQPAAPGGGGGGACRASAATPVARVSAAPVAGASAIGVMTVAEFLGARLAERGVNMGFDYVLRMSGASTAETRTLARLDGISEQVAGINTRLNQVMGAVGSLINERREAEFDRELRRLCGIATQQRLALQRYNAAVRAGVELGRILETENGLKRAEEPGPNNRISPRQRARDRANDFVQFYGENALALEQGIDELRTALIPGAQLRTALALYGDVLMTHRWLRRPDSKRMRALYDELAEMRALASWMSAEYWAARHDDVEVNRVLAEYNSDRKRALRKLPRMIPAGAVIDAGSVAARSVNGKPIWFAPVARDLGWVPRQPTASRPGEFFAVDEVPRELGELNRKQRLGTGWKAPTREQLEALLSTECAVDPADRGEFLGDGQCQNAVGRNSNVARYLERLNPAKNWQRLFCLDGALVECPPDSGPLASGPRPRHLFIWTDDAQSQRIECGREDIPRRTFWHRYSTYTGFRTTTDDQRHTLFPHLPRRSPNFRVWVRSASLSECDRYFAHLVFDVAGVSRRNRYSEGVLLATRFTGKQDLSADGTIDYMAQTVGR